MAATDEGGQRLKGTLAARHPKTDELHTFDGGTPREDLPSWVQVDDGAFDGEPAEPKRSTRRRSAAKKDADQGPSGDDEPSGGDDEQGDDDGASTAGDEQDDEDAAPTPPPRGGPGSGADAWRAYAEAVGVTVGADATRDDVVDALQGEGKPVE